MRLFKHPDAIVLAPIVAFIAVMAVIMFCCIFTSR